jgi:predicted MFS family arabinose efflux permease
VGRNPALLCVHHALMMSLFPMAVLTLFQQDHLGLSMTEIMLVQALFGLSLAVFEFPSGYLADRIGYRLTLIIASALSICGWGLYALASGFPSVAIAEISLGIALSLVSGTNSAMLYESLANRGREEDFARWFGRTRFFGQLAEGSAALVAGLLFAYWIRLPFLLMVGVWIANLVIACLLVEPRFARHTVARPLEHLRTLLTFVLRRAPRLRALFSVGVVFGLASFVPVWMIALYARDSGVPVSWLGPIWAIANYVVAFGSLASNRLHQGIGLHAILILATGLIGVGYFGLGGTQAWWAFVFYFAFCMSRGLVTPVLAHAEQAEIPSGDRASLVSLRSLLFRLAFLIVGPAAGLAIDRRGQHAVLIGLGLAFVVLAALSLGALRRAPAARRADADEPSLRQSSPP